MSNIPLYNLPHHSYEPDEGFLTSKNMMIGLVCVLIIVVGFVIYYFMWYKQPTQNPPNNNHHPTFSDLPPNDRCIVADELIYRLLSERNKPQTNVNERPPETNENNSQSSTGLSGDKAEEQ